VRLSFLLQSDTTVYAWNDEALAVSADLTSVFGGQIDLGGHGYFSGCVYIVLGDLGVFGDVFFGQSEKVLDALLRYALCVCVHFGFCLVDVQFLFSELVFSMSRCFVFDQVSIVGHAS
jgi:hypothetical protein